MNSYNPALTITSNPSFDSDFQFYLCADKDGTSPLSCTISTLTFEYRYYGDTSFVIAHHGGTDRIWNLLICSYPLI